jgi:hypothetical protein
MWKDNIKMGFGEIGSSGMDLTNLNPDSGQGRALVITVTNHRVT